MQQHENLLHINNGQQIDAIHIGYRQTRASRPVDPVYWTFIQTGRRSDPGLESILTLKITVTCVHRTLVQHSTPTNSTYVNNTTLFQ